jgi:hypothetical protein
MKERFAALPTLLLVLAGVFQATRGLGGAPASETGSSAASKLAQAERVVVYGLTTAGGPRFRLPAGSQVVQLIVHLELPRVLSSLSPGASYAFTVQATLRGPGGELLWERSVRQRTRQTRAGQHGDEWDYEAAFVPGGRMDLSDSGKLELRLPTVQDEAMLELRLGETAGLLAADGTSIAAPIAGPTALVRAYRRVDLDPAEVELRRVALAADSGMRRLAGASYLPWYALPEALQRHRLGVGWERLAAEGRAGVDYDARSMYVSPSRPTLPPAMEEPALTIARGQPVVVQLHGPGAVELRAWPIGAIPEDREPSAQLRLRWLGPERAAESEASAPAKGRSAALAGRAGRSAGAVPKDSTVGSEGVEIVRVLNLRDGEVGRTPITLGAGWWSLELHTDLPGVAVQVRADGAERHAGPDDHAQHRSDVGEGLVPVDLLSLPVYTSGPGLAPLPISLAPDGGPESRLVQVDLRAWGELAPVAVRYSFVDAAGAEIVSGDATADTSMPAPFERLRRPGSAVGAGEDGDAQGEAQISELLPGQGLAAQSALGVPERPVRATLGFALGEAPVSEPVPMRLLAPPGAARLLVWTEQSALVSVHGRLPVTNREPAATWVWPYDQTEARPLLWRHAPRIEPQLFPRRVDDHAARVEAGQLMLIQAQVRAEEPPLAVHGPAGWEVLHPRGTHLRLKVLERVAPGRRNEALAEWGPGSYMRLTKGVRERVNLAGLGPARVSYQTTGPGTAVVGEHMTLAVGGKPLGWRVTSSTGKKVLPARGVAELRWTEGPSQMTLLIDRPPVGPSTAPLYQFRHVHRLGAGGLTFTVDKPDAAPVILNVVVYWFDDTPREINTLQLEIDGGDLTRVGARTRRSTASVSRVQVMPAMRSEVLFADRRGLSGASLARVAVVLGQDLAPGKHTVRVSPVSGPPVWLRAFQAGATLAGEVPLQWNERLDGVTLESRHDAEM